MPKATCFPNAIDGERSFCHNQSMTVRTKTLSDRVPRTLRVRVKDKHAKTLSKMAFEVNQVWNAANEISRDFSWVPIPGVGYINLNTSEYDIQKELRSIRTERDMSIGAATVQSVIGQHARSRKQSHKNKLGWRSLSGAKRALGWVPFKKAGIKLVNGQIRFCGTHFSIWDSYGLAQHNLGTGSFSEDARGRWYFNTIVEVEVKPSEGKSAIGIDLGLKTVATCSDGITLEAKRLTNKHASALATAQRAHKARRVRAIHAKIKHARHDMLHKFSTMLVDRYGAVFVGDVSSVKLVKTRMAKSVLDAGWGMLREQLRYKAIARSVIFAEVNERNTTQTCSSCGVISASSPKGRAGLGIREWSCSTCGAQHDRDINAAKNILRLGHQALAVGIPLLPAQAAAAG
jgi:transposase